MSLLKKLAGETALYGLSSIVGRFLNYLLVPIYTRTLTEAENGVLTELYAYSAFLMVILSYRLESAFFRYGTPGQDRPRAYSTAMYSLLGSTFAVTVLVLCLAGPIAGGLQYGEHPEYIQWFALILAFDCLAELPFAHLRLEQRPRRFVTAKLFNIGLTLVLNLFWLVFCPWAARQGWSWVHYVWSAEVRVGYVFLANLIASAGTLAFLSPQLAAIRQAAFDKALWREMVVYAAPLIFVQFAGIVNSMFDRALQKWLLPGTPEENLADVGIYGNNYKLAMLITIFTQAYRYAAEPFFFRTASDADAPALQARVTKWFTIASAAGMLGVLLFIDVVKYFLSEPYWVGLHLVPILLLANVLLGLYYNLSVWYRLKDKTRVGAVIALVGAGVTVGLNLALVPRIGYDGSAWAALICYALMCWLVWYTGRQHYPVPYEFGRMALYIGVVMACYGLSRWAAGALPAAAFWFVNVMLLAGFVALVVRLERVELGRLVRRRSG